MRQTTFRSSCAAVVLCLVVALAGACDTAKDNGRDRRTPTRDDSGARRHATKPASTKPAPTKPAPTKPGTTASAAVDARPKPTKPKWVRVTDRSKFPVGRWVRTTTRAGWPMIGFAYYSRKNHMAVRGERIIDSMPRAELIKYVRERGLYTMIRPSIGKKMRVLTAAEIAAYGLPLKPRWLGKP